MLMLSFLFFLLNSISNHLCSLIIFGTKDYHEFNVQSQGLRCLGRALMI